MYHTNDASKCPACNHKLNGASSVNDEGEERSPSPGDIGVCIACGAALTYTDEVTVVLLTQDEMSQLPDESIEELLYAQAQVGRLNSMSGVMQ